jgi:hypothetical protein
VAEWILPNIYLSMTFSSSDSAPHARRGFILLIALFALFAAAKPILYDTLDPDCFWHLRVADQLLAQAHISPIVDHLSFSSEKTPWTPYSWLAELAMKGLWDTGGFRLALVVQAMLQAAFVILLALSAIELQRQFDDSPRYLPAALATAAGLYLSLAFLSFRPATFAIVLLSLAAWLILRDRRLGEKSKAVWLLIPLAILLINIHLSAILLPLWLTALLLGSLIEKNPRGIRRYALLTAATILACLATPMLPGLIGSILHYQFADVMVASPALAEMQPFYRGLPGKISALLVLAIFLCALFHRKKLRPGLWLWLAISTALLFRLGRMAPIFAIIAAPIFAATMPKISDAPLANPLSLASIAAILLAGLIRITLAFPSAGTSLDAFLNRNGPNTPGYPAAATDYVQSHIPPVTGHLINEFTWGGYLEYRLSPHFQTLLDGRTQLFTNQFWQTTCLGPEPARRNFLAHTPADAAILSVDHSLFAASLLKLGWTRIYQDDRAQVMIPPRGADVAHADLGE